MIHHAKGPLTSAVSEKQALQEVKAHPSVPDDAEIAVWDEDGHWVAAWHTSSWTHQAEFPPAGPKDEEESSPSPKHESPEAPSEDGPPSDDGEPSEDGGGDEAPKDKPGDEHGDKGGEQHIIHELLTMVQAIGQALGITPDLGGAESPAPGEDVAPPPPGPPAPPHGHAGPEGPDQTVQHQRALKPGEAPPGATPVGAPAFASTIPDDHPWKDQIGKTATFTVESDPISETAPLAPISSELERIAYGTGFKVKQISEGRDEAGERIARALISRY